MTLSGVMWLYFELYENCVAELDRNGTWRINVMLARRQAAFANGRRPTAMRSCDVIAECLGNCGGCSRHSMSDRVLRRFNGRSTLLASCFYSTSLSGFHAPQTWHSRQRYNGAWTCILAPLFVTVMLWNGNVSWLSSSGCVAFSFSFLLLR